MGDIIHTLPAVASLKHSFPGSQLTWVVEPQWEPLLRGNPFIDRIAFLRRGRPASVLASCRELRRFRFDFAVDFQGLMKSAVLASIARPDRIFGFHQSRVRERMAALFYSNKTLTNSAHRVDQYLDLAGSAGAASVLRTFPLPEGEPEGLLPKGYFVLASPLAGWGSKQWPAQHYGELGALLQKDLGIPLVLNVPPGTPEVVPGAFHHYSSLAGLIDATRRALAVVGVDSGPLHLAAALGKPGVAIYGPTDPAIHGPYGETFAVLRSPNAVTSYKRFSSVDPSMSEISPQAVFDALKVQLYRGCSA